MSSVTVAIVNYNTGDELEPCLQSVAADLASSAWHAVIVDNASRDNRLADLDRFGDRVTVIRNAVNRGFGAAVNQAARQNRAPWLLLLNPDCRVRPGMFERLAAVIGALPRCAIAGPRLVDASGVTQESARGEPTALTGLFGRHGALSRVFPRSGPARDNLRAAAIVHSGAESAEVDWVMGAAMLIRRDVFDSVGGFDERFFLYWEDADLCRRVRDRGFTVRYVPSAQVMHAGGRSSRSARAPSIRAFHRSAYQYYARHVAPSRWNPSRWLAWIALTARAYWRILAARS